MSNRIIDIILHSASVNAEKTAIIDASGSIRFRELEQDVRRTASHLQKVGIKRGQRVLLLVPFSIDLYRVTMAANMLGATVIFVEDWISFKQIGYCIRSAPPDAVISDWKGLLYCHLHRDLRRIPKKIKHNRYKIYSPLKDIPEIDEEVTAMISFTSGVSGIPKQVNRSFRHLLHQFHTLEGVKKSVGSDIELVSMPAFVFINLVTGATTVLADYNKLKPGRINFRKIIDQISTNKVNAICSSPAFLVRLARSIGDSSLRLQIRKVLTGGAPVFPSDATILKEIFPNARTTILYGSSEAEPISMIDASELAGADKLAASGLRVGKVHEGCKVFIKPVHSGTLLHGQWEIGEILVSGPNVVSVEKGKENLRIMIEGTLWHPTGDSGYFNTAGELVLTGPVNSLIRVEDRLWSPFVFEALTRNVEGVFRAVLVQVDDKIVGVLQAEDDAQQSSILEGVQSLPCPVSDWIFISEFPTDARHRGKIKYDEVQQYAKSYLARNT